MVVMEYQADMKLRKAKGNFWKRMFSNGFDCILHKRQIEILFQGRQIRHRYISLILTLFIKTGGKIMCFNLLFKSEMTLKLT